MKNKQHSIADRISDLVVHFADGNNTKFALAVGTSEANIRNYINGTMPKFDIIASIAETFEINFEWLLLGKGSMLRSDEKTSFKEEKLAIPTDNPVGIPLIGLEVAAGFGSSDFAIHESDIQNRYLIPDFVDIDYMVRVKGDSMIPKYSAGDIIACRIIRESKFIQWNKCYIIGTTEQGLLVKRVKKGANDNSLLLVSENKDYDPFEIPISEITGMALVVGVIRME